MIDIDVITNDPAIRKKLLIGSLPALTGLVLSYAPEGQFFGKVYYEAIKRS